MEYNSGSPIYLQVINELKKKMVKGVSPVAAEH